MEIQLKPRLNTICLLSRRPVGIYIAVDSIRRVGGLRGVLINRLNSGESGAGTGLNARKGLLGLDTLRLDETLDIKLLGTIRGIQRGLAELILNLPGFETPPSRQTYERWRCCQW